MEMHQIRYFLAVSRLLNFTRAAEECNVTQPSLTRAIKKLEDELGGELFRRERQNTHVTELGHMMLPLLRQSYNGALSAKSIAGSYITGDHAPLSLALCKSINIAPFVPSLVELTRAMTGLVVDFHRGTRAEVLERLKSGEAELALGAPFDPGWDRLNAWALYVEDFALMVNENHRLAQQDTIGIAALADERLLMRPYCDSSAPLSALLDSNGRKTSSRHLMADDDDVIALLEANAGVAVLPRNARCSNRIQAIDIDGLELHRTIYLYEVAGRRRSPAATGLIKILRACELETAPVRETAARASLNQTSLREIPGGSIP